MDGNDNLWYAHGQRLGLNAGQLAELRKQSTIPLEKAGVFLRDIQQSALSKTRVSCFSEIPDNILMWSHYADHHRGICTIFETQKRDTIQYLVFEKDDVNYKNPTLPPDYGGIIKVRYDDQLPSAYNHLEYDQNKIAPFLFTKSKAWTYESEWRLIFPEHAVKSNNVRYIKNQLKGIIFGLNCSPNDRNAVHSILKGSVAYYEATPVRNKYHLILQNFSF